jgi:hypothetical protein
LKQGVRIHSNAAALDALMERGMSEQWQYQLWLYLADELAEAARRSAGAPELGLSRILEKHGAIMKCQLDPFADYAAQAEVKGVESYPLYEWTIPSLGNQNLCARRASRWT